MDQTDRTLLNIIQKDFPITERPFTILGNELSISETEVINRINNLKYNEGIIRDISAIFNTKLLGFTSCLIAIKTEDNNLFSVTEFINNNPSVSHNYIRDNEYNVWFTLAMKDITHIKDWVNDLKKKFNLSDVLILPSNKVFKRNVFFNLLADKHFNNIDESFKKEITKINNTDKTILALLEKDLPIMNTPFKELSEKANVSENFFIETALKYKSNKLIRRFAAVLRHNKVGFLYNALIVWKINNELIDSVGNKFASLDFVSHCYEREEQNNWQYNLYTMIHATSNELLYEYIDKLNSISNNSPYLTLKTLKELKKERVKYFSYLTVDQQILT